MINHISPGERNPIEGKFGQGKTKYGLDNIKAKLSTTSISWIAAIAKPCQIDEEGTFVPTISPAL